jgi:hypothetical protein
VAAGRSGVVARRAVGRGSLFTRPRLSGLPLDGEDVADSRLERVVVAAKEDLITSLEAVLAQYRDAFAEKIYGDESDQHDLLMDVFSVTPEQKRENRQYWGRELGMCWQRLVTALCKATCAEFEPALRFGQDEPCDLVVGPRAIDTKYRVGSGDSGTLKKFKQ